MSFCSDLNQDRNDRPIPNLFVVGASKCGTTYFFSILSKHPDVCFSRVKEPLHFQRADHLSYTDAYIDLFRDCSEHQIVAEATPIYAETTTFPLVPERLFAFNSMAQVILLVRNPKDRLLSVWKQALSTGHHRRLTYYAAKMPERFEEALFAYPPMVEATRYWTHLQAYRAVFSDDQIKVVFFEDLVSDPDSVVRDVCEFLAIDPGFRFDFGAARKNESTGKVRYQPIVQYLVQNRIVQTIHRIIPLTGIYRALRRVSHPVPTDIKIDQKTMERIREILQPEVEALLRDQGKPTDYWKL